MKVPVKWIVLGCLVVFALIVGMYAVAVRNQEVDLRNQATAQEKANTVVFDKVWKVLAQKAQISDKYKDSFKDIYHDIMDARYQGEAKNAPLLKFVTEQNPQFSVDLYKDLADAVEANRSEFERVQNRLIDIKREHTNLLQKFPSSLFVGSRPMLDIRIVTSDKTETIFKTGKEDNVDLFK